MSDETVSSSEQRGSILFDQGRYLEAEDYFRKALAQEPNDPLVLSKLALCELHQQRASKALDTIQRAIALSPETSHLYALRAFIEVELRRPDNALKSAEAALELDPESDDAFVAQAAAYIHRNEWAKAERSARAALEINPNHSGAATQLAHALRLQNRLHESTDQIAYMLSQDPEDADTHVAAGWTALQRGEREQAEKHFLESLRLEPHNETAREGLKEAFRARSAIYRAYLNYCFFMQRFNRVNQWLIIIGVVIILKFARLILPAPILGLVILAYVIFVLWAHLARAVGNFQLTFDRVARHALDRMETVEAYVTGGGVIVGVLLLLAGVIGRWPAIMILGATLIVAAFPFAYTFTNTAHGRWLFGAIGGFVICAGTLNLLQYASGLPREGWLNAISGIAVFGVIATTWLCNLSAFNSRRQ